MNGDIRRKTHENRQFPPLVFNAPAEGVRLGIVYWRRGGKKKFSDRFSHFDTIPACDGQPPSRSPSQPASQPARHVAVPNTLYALRRA